MKILVFTSSLRVGGAESMSIELANALAGAGEQVWLASAGGPLRDNVDPAVTWIRVDNPNGALLRCAGQLAQHLREIQPDVVHSHGATCALVAAIARRRVRYRPALVLTHHSRIFRRAPRPISAWIMRRTSDHFVAISSDKRVALEEIGIPPERISLIPNFVDVDAVARRVDDGDRAEKRAALDIPAGAAVVAMAGRVLPEKGFDRFVHIVDAASGSIDRELIGIAIGDGPALDDVRRQADALGARVRFTGYERDIFPWLAVADAVLFPSRHPEVLPMFLIEAAAAGLPAVASDIPGNRDIVAHERSGFLESGDDAAWAATVARLFATDDLRRSLGAGARQIAKERFDKPRVVGETVALYRGLLS